MTIDGEHRDIIAGFLDGDGAGEDNQPTAPGNDESQPGAPGASEDGAPTAEPDSDTSDDTTPAPGARLRLPHADPARGAVGWLANRPTPGGILVLIAAILFFVFAVVPLGPHGETRLFLIWKSLTGGATVPPDTAEIAQEQADQANNNPAWSAFWTATTEIITDITA